MNLLIDTSVLVSSLGEDINTRDSQLFFKKVKKEEIIIPTLVIMETSVVLGKQGVLLDSKLLNYLLSFQVINLDQKLTIKFFKLIRDKVILKTSDFIVAASSKIYKATLITWDKKLLSSDNTICKALNPKDYVSQL